MGLLSGSEEVGGGAEGRTLMVRTGLGLVVVEGEGEGRVAEATSTYEKEEARELARRLTSSSSDSLVQDFL